MDLAPNPGPRKAKLLGGRDARAPATRSGNSRLRLVGEAHPAFGAQRAGVVGADFDRAADVERDDDALAGDSGRDHASTLGQWRRHLDHPPVRSAKVAGAGRWASPAAENAIADDCDDDRDAEHRGGTGNQHQPAHFGDDLRLCRAQRLVIAVVGFGHERNAGPGRDRRGG